MTISTSIFDAALDTLAKVKTYLGGDEKRNVAAVDDSTHVTDADNWNKLVAGLAEVARRIVTGGVGTGLVFTPTAVKFGAYNAAFGDFVRCSGIFTVSLPPITSGDLGKVVAVKCEATGPILCNPTGGAAIGDLSGPFHLSAVAGGQPVIVIAVTTSLWWIMQGVPSS